MKTSFNRQRYTPSSELVRVNQEKARNHNRRNDYLEKKGELDVSDPQDGLDIAQASDENMLLQDPGYQEFIDNVNDTPF